MTYDTADVKVFTDLPCCPGSMIEIDDGDEIGRCTKCGALIYVGLRLAEKTRAPGVHSSAIIEPSVQLGENAQVGYFSIIRGRVRAGRNLRLGSHASIEGDVTIGDDVTIRGKCEIPNCIIGDRVNIYAGVKFYDTPNPPDGPNVPPVIEDDVTICCDSAILGGVRIGKGSFIGARCFVTEDVPPNSYVTAVHEVKVRPRRS